MKGVKFDSNLNFASQYSQVSAIEFWKIQRNTNHSSIDAVYGTPRGLV